MSTSLFKLILISSVSLILISNPGNAQKIKIGLKKGKSLLNKVKKVTEPEKKSSSTINLPADGTTTTETGKNERKLNPPDVIKEISNARVAFNDKSYTETRFYIQQAIMGIELEIGHKMLNSFPKEALGLSADLSRDVVYSSGAGFIGMEVSREYLGDNGSVKATIANSSVLSESHFAVSTMAAGSYDEQTKVTRYKGYKVVLEADDYSGYKMTIPFGETSVFQLSCGVCQTEDELIKGVDLFDIDEFKTLLGEK